MDSRVAAAELQDLVSRKLVLQTGTRRWARYELSQRLRGRTSAGTSASTRADRRPQLLDALGDETLSRAELARRTGLTDQTVRRWLSIMREEGTVELVGSSPAARPPGTAGRVRALFSRRPVLSSASRHRSHGVIMRLEDRRCSRYLFGNSQSRRLGGGRGIIDGHACPHPALYSRDGILRKCLCRARSSTVDGLQAQAVMCPTTWGISNRLPVSPVCRNATLLSAGIRPLRAWSSSPASPLPV